MWRIRTVVEDVNYLLLGMAAAATLFCWGYTAAHMSVSRRPIVVDACDVARDQ